MLEFVFFFSCCALSTANHPGSLRIMQVDDAMWVRRRIRARCTSRNKTGWQVQTVQRKNGSIVQIESVRDFLHREAWITLQEASSLNTRSFHLQRAGCVAGIASNKPGHR